MNLLIHTLCSKGRALGTCDGPTHPAFFRCFKRFISRRGLPKIKVSDNGKTVMVAARSIQDDNSTFNIPKAPWWGGVFESVVGIVKRSMKKMLCHARLSYNKLLTELLRVEINSHPLTVVSPEDTENSLTRSHLIIGHQLGDTLEPQCQEPKEFEVDCDVMIK